MGMAETNFVKIEGTKVHVNATGLAEVKIALKELKLKKKEYTLIKRQLTDQQKAIRATYTQEVRSRGSMLRGGGGFGRLVRAFQTVSRDNTRANLANDLAPFENQKFEVEAVIAAIESCILQIESALLKHGG